MSVGRSHGRSQSSTHLDIDEIGLADFRRPESLASRQLRRWQRQWESSKTRDLPAIDRLARYFASCLPDEQETVLVHGDYHLGNASDRQRRVRSAPCSTGSCARPVTPSPTSA